MIEAYTHPPYDSCEEVFRHCLEILRTQAIVILNRETHDSNTLRQLEEIRKPILRDYWEVIERLKFRPCDATKFVFKDIFSLPGSELC